jgi:NAD(P)-dependent dehydrogenase (short-subunit alcohol dehydrogenase family)
MMAPMGARFQGQVVWVTGASSGIGRALALEFARQGASVVVSARRAPLLDEVVREIEAQGGVGLSAPFDVRDEEAQRAAVVAILDAFGRLDVAVANAGISVSGPASVLDAEAWRLQMDVNVLGLMHTVRVALPELRRSAGRVVLMASVTAFVNAAGYVAYNASKHAVRAIGETLNAELKGTGVSCTTIYPGYVESNIARVDNRAVFHPEREDHRPQVLVCPADRAARAMVRGIAGRRREVVVTGHARVATFVARRFPLLTGWILRAMARPGWPSRLPEPAALPIPLETPGIHLRQHRPLQAHRLLLRALPPSLRRRQGRLPRSASEGIPAITVELPGHRVDPARLALFRRVCGYDGSSDRVPAGFPPTLFLGLMAEAICSPGFPLSPLGLIHIAQQLVQHEPLEADQAMDLRCKTVALRQRERGIEVDFALELRQRAELRWQGRATLLSRRRRPRRASRRDPKPPLPEPPGQGLPVEVPGHMGRAFAAASGDRSPHHLWRITAWPLGYRRPIAQGLWTLARSLAELEKARALPARWQLRVRFRKPVEMPTRIHLHHGQQEDPLHLEVRDEAGRSQHLIGTLESIE